MQGRERNHDTILDLLKQQAMDRGDESRAESWNWDTSRAQVWEQGQKQDMEQRSELLLSLQSWGLMKFSGLRSGLRSGRRLQLPMGLDGKVRPMRGRPVRQSWHRNSPGGRI